MACDLYGLIEKLDGLRIGSSSGSGAGTKEDQQPAIVLCDVHAHVETRDACARVTVRQVFENKTDRTVCAEYRLPLLNTGILSDVKLVIGSTVLQGVVQARAKARKTYEDAVQQGEAAALVEQHRSDVWVCDVGNIGPKQSVRVELKYDTLCAQVDNVMQVIIPTWVAPRYNPQLRAPTIYDIADAESRMLPAGGQTMMSTLASLRSSTSSASTTTAAAAASAAMNTADMDIDTTTPITNDALARISRANKFTATVEVQVSTALQDVKLADPRHFKCQITPSASSSVSSGVSGQKHATIQIEQAGASLEADVVIAVQVVDLHMPRVLRESCDATKTEAFQVSFTPQVLPPSESGNVKTELLFILDCSGSMQGEPILAVKETMRQAMLALDQNLVYFNIFSFGSSWKSLFKEPASVSSSSTAATAAISSSKAVNDDTRNAALQYLKTMDADLGGTEVEPVLRHVLGQTTKEGYPRQVIFLTDGQVENTAEVLALVAKHKTSMRLFSIGMGSSVSRDLVDGVARVGGGLPAYINTTTKEEVSQHINALLLRILQPAYTEVSLFLCPPVVTASGKSSSGDDKDVEATMKLGIKIATDPVKRGAVYGGNRMVMYAIIPEATVPANSEAVVVLRSNVNVEGQKESTRQCRFPLSSVVHMKHKDAKECTVHRLGVQVRLQGLQDIVDTDALAFPANADAAKKESLDLCLQYGVASHEASFVCVAKNASSSSSTEDTVVPTRVLESTDESDQAIPSLERQNTGSSSSRSSCPRSMGFMMAAGGAQIAAVTASASASAPRSRKGFRGCSPQGATLDGSATMCFTGGAGDDAEEEKEKCVRIPRKHGRSSTKYESSKKRCTRASCDSAAASSSMDRDLLDGEGDVFVQHKAKQGKQNEHTNVSCDACGMMPIVGRRFKCLVCANYDHCQACHDVHIGVPTPTTTAAMQLSAAATSGPSSSKEKANSTAGKHDGEHHPFTCFFGPFQSSKSSGVEDLLMQRAGDGCWHSIGATWFDDLAKALLPKMDSKQLINKVVELQRAVSSIPGVTGRTAVHIVATCIAIFFLKTVEAANISRHQLVLNAATRWLSRICQSTPPLLAPMISPWIHI